MPEVRYVEPIGYTIESEINFRNLAGCIEFEGAAITEEDFVATTPEAIIPWNFMHMNIPQAWQQSTGEGITIALIDTGTSADQDKLGDDFASGESENRQIERTGTYVSALFPWAQPDGPDDRCGHGTTMAGLLAAPKGYGNSIVGVAYQSNLLAIRGTGDVLLMGSRKIKGAANAIRVAADSEARIFSMSIGTIFWSNRIADAVYYAYGKDKLLFAAAGTSTWFTSWVGVVFPARMPEVVSVTGVKEGMPLQKCGICHTGEKVDFAAVMERQEDGSRTSLSLSMEGNDPRWSGGSSAATAITAGIAALTWSKYPDLNREMILEKLKQASQFYPERNDAFGWGIIDAEMAVSD